MTESSTEGASTALRWSCGAPLALLLGIELYVRGFDGWGAWASAPLLLVPALLALPIAMLGSAELVAAARARAPIGRIAFCTLVAALPILWLGIRRYFM